MPSLGEEANDSPDRCLNGSARDVSAPSYPRLRARMECALLRAGRLLDFHAASKIRLRR